MKNYTNGSVKALAAKDESSHILGLKRKYRLDTLVDSRGTSPDRNRTVHQRVVPSLVPVVYDPIGVVAHIPLKPCYS